MGQLRDYLAEREIGERETDKMKKMKIVSERCRNHKGEITRLVERVRVRENEKKRLRKVES